MPTETVRLSPSIAKILLDKSPKHAWNAHRLLGGQTKKPSAAQIKGEAVDKLIFGGEVPKLTKSALEEAEAIAGAVKDALLARGIFGTAQYRLEWNNGVTDCSGVVDLFDSTAFKFYELKTTHDAGDYNITKQIEQYRYDVQYAAYVEGLEEKFPEIDGLQGSFIFVETSAPYDVRFVNMTPAMLQSGQAAWADACEKWEACRRYNDWHGRGDFTADVSGYRKRQETEKWLADSGIE